MFSKLTANGRIWILLLAWLLFAALSWADTFDLSDDIVLPTTVGQPVIEEEASEIKNGICLVVWMVAALSVCLPLVSHRVKSLILSSEAWLFISDPLLYQRFSTYRI
jgi:hypothetical protein